MREAMKIASQSLASAISSGSPGKTSLAHSGVAQATIVQLIWWRVMSSIAGFEAFDMATLARATRAGSCFASRAGFAPAIAMRAAPLRNAAAMASCSHYRSVVEARVRCVGITREHGGVVAVEGRHQQSAGLVGVFGDAAHQRQSFDGRGENQFLTLTQPKADLVPRLRRGDPASRQR